MHITNVLALINLPSEYIGVSSILKSFCVDFVESIIHKYFKLKLSREHFKN